MCLSPFICIFSLQLYSRLFSFFLSLLDGLAPLLQAVPVVLAMDITDAVAGQIDLDEVLEIGPLQFVTDKVVQILHEGYKKEVANELAQFEAEGGKVAGRSGGREAVGRSANDTAQEVHRRAKRQVIDVPIPTLQGHVPGRSRCACGLLASHAHQNPFVRVGCHVYPSRSQGQGPVLLCVLCIIPSADQNPSTTSSCYDDNITHAFPFSIWIRSSINY